jgi:predicted extracellular nuclease
VRELGDGGGGTLTSLEPIAIEKTGTAEIPVTVLHGPPEHGWESLEGQRVVIEAPLTVTDNGSLYRYGEVALAFGGRLYAPTELAPPGPEAQVIAADNARRLLRIDDARQATDIDTVWYLPAHADAAPLRAGSTVGRIEGVVDERFGTVRLQLLEAIADVGQAPRPAPPTVPGDRRIAGFNVLNLFNGDGDGGGFPTERGAASRQQYVRQQAKLVAVVQALDPDLAALMELENDGYGPASSLAQFVAALNAAGPHDDWRFVDAGEGPGDNPIRVGIIYRATRFTPVGRPVTLIDGPFADQSRAPLVQAFRAGRGPVFVVAANHFKSKGCGRAAEGGEADQGDGQACFNPTRVRSARRLHDWLATDPTGTDPAGALVIGDLNAHAQEDPLRLLRERGWQDAFALAGAKQPYSFIFAGLSARLDHALIDAGLAGRLRGAAQWHNSADESDRFDYRHGAAADPWRASDHDPMLLGLDLTR